MKIPERPKIRRIRFQLDPDGDRCPLDDFIGWAECEVDGERIEDIAVCVEPDLSIRIAMPFYRAKDGTVINPYPNLSPLVIQVMQAAIRRAVLRQARGR